MRELQTGAGIQTCAAQQRNSIFLLCCQCYPVRQDWVLFECFCLYLTSSWVPLWERTHITHQSLKKGHSFLQVYLCINQMLTASGLLFVLPVSTYTTCFPLWRKEDQLRTALPLCRTNTWPCWLRYSSLCLCSTSVRRMLCVSGLLLEGAACFEHQFLCWVLCTRFGMPEPFSV